MPLTTASKYSIPTNGRTVVARAPGMMSHITNLMPNWDPVPFGAAGLNIIPIQEALAARVNGRVWGHREETGRGRQKPLATAE